MNASPPPKLALVTGGSRRLGAVITRQLAQDGYDIAITSSNPDARLEPELAALLKKQKRKWKLFTANLSDYAAAPDVIGKVKDHFGYGPGLLVNNAAIFGQDQWHDMDASALEAHFGLNVFAPLLLSAAMVKAADTQTPAIIHILDQRIRNPHGDQLSYSLSKQALAASVRNMAAAFGPRARVNGVAPGLVIKTDEYDRAQMKKLDAMTPLGKLPNPQSVADAVSYLAGADDVTGQIIYADGGANLRSYDRDFLYL